MFLNLPILILQMNSVPLCEIFLPTVARANEISGDETDPGDFIDVFPNFKNASSPSCKVRIECDEKWGNRMIASCDVEPGTAIQPKHSRRSPHL